MARLGALLRVALLAGLTGIGTRAVAQESPPRPPASANSSAPAPPPDRFVFTVTPDLALPVGGWTRQGVLGFGATLDLRYRLEERIGLTARLGYLYFFSKSVGDVDHGSSTLPFLLGLQYQLSPDVFVSAELGVARNTNWVDTGNVTISRSRNGFAFALGAGYDTGPVAIIAKFLATDWGDDGVSFKGAFLLGVQIPITTF